MNKTCKNYLRFIVDNPIKTLLTGIFLVGSLFMGTQKLETDFGYRIWFQQDNPKLQEFDAFERRFGSDETAVVIVHSPSGIFDTESMNFLLKLTEDLWLAPEVIRVDSLTNFQWVHAEEDDIIVEDLIYNDEPLTQDFLNERKKLATNHRTLEGFLINKAGDTAIVYVNLKPSMGGTPDYENVALAIREITKKYSSISDHEFYLTGQPLLNFSFKESTEMDMGKLIPFVLLLTVLFLFLNLRRVSGMFLSLLIIFVTIAVTFGFAGWTGIKIHNLTAMTGQFMIAICIAVSVHILVTYYQLLNKIPNKRNALLLTVEKNFLPTLLTSISTSIGFFSFLSAEIPAIVDMGVLAGTGTLLSWLFAYLILVPLLRLIPAKPSKNTEFTTDEKAHAPSEFALKYTKKLVRYRPLVIGAYAILITISIAMLFKIQTNSDPFKYFDKTYPLTIATDFVEDNVGGALGVEMVIDSGEKEGIKNPDFLKKVDSYQQWVDSFDFVTKTISIVDVLKEMNKTLNGGNDAFYGLPETRESIAQQLFLYTMNLPQGLDINNRVSIENDALRLTAMWTLHDSESSLKVIDMFEKKAASMGLNLHVTGKIPLYQSNNELVVTSYIKTLGIALVLIAILLCFGLKSIRIGLLSMIPNAIPIIIGGACLPLFGVPLDVGTVIISSVCLGIAVDDTIHFLTNFTKYTANGDSNELAVAKVFTHTAPALVTTTMVLVAAFATFAFGTFVPNQNFGKFVAIILTVALATDLTLLPAIFLKKKA
ncbi:hypothetical protein DID80_04235 [Candidatus Marinamargulisbacteria bacterium SCGC AAA071-K20]|nr:hypothetical protein DID80_04235 [Candidatus Marinamargulisbacteria bacterium SCGC AAA071-K20]